MFSPENLLTEWSRLVVLSLVRAGVREAIISPGSRSTPLVAQALRESELHCHSVIDERSAGFFALGMSRAGGPPPVLICTSGSALTHYLPALVEATHAGLPLLVLSADRPQELESASAPQTIDQVEIFGRTVKSSRSLGDPGADEDNLRAASRKVLQAVTESLSGRPGPVHLNFPARKPLEPVPPLTAEQHALTSRVSRIVSEGPERVFPSRLTASADAISELVARFEQTAELLISVGPTTTPLTERVAQLGRSQGAFVFCEQPGHATPVDGLARGLTDKNGSRLPPPKQIVHFGPAPVSSAWQAGLKTLAAELACVAGVGHPDPTSRARLTVTADLDDLLARLTEALSDRPIPKDRARFTAAYERAADAVREAIERESALAEYGRHSIPPPSGRPLSEPALVKTVLSALPPGAQLCLGNSLAIRLAAWVSPVTPTRELSVFTQRGASGIDGLIAGAAGTALSTQMPTLLLLGDVSCAHDLSSLAVARTLPCPLCIFVLDNAGGGLFEHLPAADQFRAQADWAFWTTPPQLDFGPIAKGYGINFRSVSTNDQARDAVTTALGRPGTTLVRAKTDPQSSLAFLRAMGPGPRPPGGFN
jgi:2-succinyl-5-enolpyruvyl-6-hydroxy-3-cyclohexene-1-carboxylate synthase